MEPNKLLLLAKKLHPSLRTKTPSVICQLILNDAHYEPIRNLLTGKQIIILSFLIIIIVIKSPGNSANVV